MDAVIVELAIWCIVLTPIVGLTLLGMGIYKLYEKFVDKN